ncbi:MAG: TrbI/VirB10 family protein [Vulcanimicrobiaceae bacterium]
MVYGGGAGAGAVSTVARAVAGTPAWLQQQEQHIANEEAQHGITPGASLATDHGPALRTARTPHNQRTLSSFTNMVNAGNTGVLATPVLPPEPYELPIGTRVPVALIGNLDSSLAGPVLATVLYDMRDPRNGALIIPRGSVLIGQFIGLKPGSDHLAIEWLWLRYPNLEKRALTSVVTTGEEGESGLSGRVNTHIVPQIRNTLIGTIASSAGMILASALSHGMIGTLIPVSNNVQTQAPQSTTIPTLYVNRATEFDVVFMADYAVAQPYETRAR